MDILTGPSSNQTILGPKLLSVQYSYFRDVSRVKEVERAALVEQSDCCWEKRPVVTLFGESGVQRCVTEAFMMSGIFD